MSNIHVPEVFPEESYNEQMKNVEALFAKSASRLFFDSFDGKKLSYIHYTPLELPALATIVISHGLSEFAEKYTETAYYFTLCGFEVFSIEHRGHGYSYRDCDNLQATHIDSFNTYMRDFEAFISDVVFPSCSTGKIILFGHSMGCTIESLFLEQSPEAKKITACVMCSPMMSFSPKYVTDDMLASFAGKAMKAEGLYSIFKYTSKPFNPNPQFVKCGDTSFNRFRRNLDKRIENDLYKNTMCTNSWIFSACEAIKTVQEKASGISVPVLMLIGEKDTVVKRSSQIKLAKSIPDCKMHVVKEAKHSVFTSESPNLAFSLAMVLDYISKFI